MRRWLIGGVAFAALIGLGAWIRSTRSGSGSGSDGTSSDNTPSSIPASSLPAKTYPLPFAIDEGVETKFILRRVPLNPCDPTKPHEPEDRTFTSCSVTVALDSETGRRTILPPTVTVDVPSDTPNPTLVRERILKGELVAIGSVQHKRQLADMHGEAWPDAGKYPDGGAATLIDDRVLVVRDTTPIPQKLPPAASGIELAVSFCPGYPATGPLAGDDERLYAMACGSLIALPKNGHGPLERIATRSLTGKQFLLDGESIYADVYGIERFPKNSSKGKPASIAAKQPGKTDARSDRACESVGGIDAQHIYCHGRDVQPDHSEPDVVYRVPKEGGDAIELARVKGNIFSVTIDDDTVYYYAWLRSDPPVKNDQVIYAVSKKGGPSRIVAESDGKGAMVNPSMLTPYGDELFWVTGCMGCPLSSTKKRGGGSITKRVSVTNSYFGALQIFDGDLYAQAHDGRVVREPVRASGKTIPPAAPGGPAFQMNGPAVHVDRTHVYSPIPYQDKTYSSAVILVRQPR